MGAVTSAAATTTAAQAGTSVEAAAVVEARAHDRFDLHLRRCLLGQQCQPHRLELLELLVPVPALVHQRQLLPRPVHNHLPLLLAVAALLAPALQLLAAAAAAAAAVESFLLKMAKLCCLRGWLRSRRTLQVVLWEMSVALRVVAQVDQAKQQQPAVDLRQRSKLNSLLRPRTSNLRSALL